MKMVFTFLVCIQILLGQNKYLDVPLTCSKNEITQKVYSDPSTQVFYNLPDKLEVQWNSAKFTFAFVGESISSILMEKSYQDKKSLDVVIESVLNLYEIQTEQIVDVKKQSGDKTTVYQYLVVRPGKVNEIRAYQSPSKTSYSLEISCQPGD